MYTKKILHTAFIGHAYVNTKCDGSIRSGLYVKIKFINIFLQKTRNSPNVHHKHPAKCLNRTMFMYI